MGRARGRRRGGDRCGGDGQDEPAPPHRPVAEARSSAAGTSADLAWVSAACAEREQRDRHGDVARSADVARTVASAARGTAEATDGGNGLKAYVDHPRESGSCGGRPTGPPGASCCMSQAYERRKYCGKL